MRTAIFAILMLSAAAANAYVGPGLGLGAIGALFGAVMAFFLALVGVVWYPIKRLLRKLKPAREPNRADHARSQEHVDGQAEQSTQT